MEELTVKQQLFVQEYLVDFNATQAAIRAEYSLNPCHKTPKYYVYALIDPRNNQIFYIGKGKNSRYAMHVRDWQKERNINGVKGKRIGDILFNGLEVITVFLEICESEQIAYIKESKFIKAIGKENLTNYHAPMPKEVELKYWARKKLYQIKPFKQWASEVKPSEAQIKGYFLVLANLISILTDITFEEAIKSVTETYLRTEKEQVYG